MANTCLEYELNKLKEMQRSDVEQVAKYKSLSMALDVTIIERAEVIKALENFKRIN